MIVHNENEMLDVGSKLAKVCQPPLVIYLQGPLGAGKTTFARGFLNGMGYTGKVKSPTYTLVECYNFSNSQLFHFDFYRIYDPDELELIGIRDYFTEGSISLIEWPELAYGRIAQADLICAFEIISEERKINFSANSLIGDKILIAFLRQIPV